MTNASRRELRWALALIFATLAFAAPAQDGPPAGESEPALEELEPLPRLEKALEEIGAHVHNASVRVRYVSQSGPTPGGLVNRKERKIVNTSQDCCVTNVKVIAERLETVTKAIRELYALHQQGRDETAINLVAHMGGHVVELQEGFRQFRQASESTAAKIGLNHMGQALNHVRRDLEEYHDCCAVGESEGA